MTNTNIIHAFTIHATATDVVSEEIDLEPIGATLDGDTIYKEVSDAYACYLVDVYGYATPYNPDRFDHTGPLYGTFIGDGGERHTI